MENIKYWSWTDELVEEFISRDPSIHRCKEDILEFKQSKQPKEEQEITLTKGKLDAMMENVWNAARDAYRIQIPNTGYKLGDVKFKYESFKDYQQSLPENKQEVDKEQAFQREIQKKYCAPNLKSETQVTSNASINCQNDKLPSCCMCGGETVLIRGKYPNTPQRNVCPTCNTERLEQISDIASKDYGQNCKGK